MPLPDIRPNTPSLSNTPQNPLHTTAPQMSNIQRKKTGNKRQENQTTPETSTFDAKNSTISLTESFGPETWADTTSERVAIFPGEVAPANITLSSINDQSTFEYHTDTAHWERRYIAGPHSIVRVVDEQHIEAMIMPEGENSQAVNEINRLKAGETLTDTYKLTFYNQETKAETTSYLHVNILGRNDMLAPKDITGYIAETPHQENTNRSIKIQLPLAQFDPDSPVFVVGVTGLNGEEAAIFPNMIVSGKYGKWTINEGGVQGANRYTLYTSEDIGRSTSNDISATSIQEGIDDVNLLREGTALVDELRIGYSNVEHGKSQASGLIRAQIHGVTEVKDITLMQEHSLLIQRALDGKRPTISSIHLGHNIEGEAGLKHLGEICGMQPNDTIPDNLCATESGNLFNPVGSNVPANCSWKEGQNSFFYAPPCEILSNQISFTFYGSAENNAGVRTSTAVQYNINLQKPPFQVPEGFFNFEGEIENGGAGIAIDLLAQFNNYVQQEQRNITSKVTNFIVGIKAYPVNGTAIIQEKDWLATFNTDGQFSYRYDDKIPSEDLKEQDLRFIVQHHDQKNGRKWDSEGRIDLLLLPNEALLQTTTQAPTSTKTTLLNTMLTTATAITTLLPTTNAPMPEIVHDNQGVRDGLIVLGASLVVAAGIVIGGAWCLRRNQGQSGHIELEDTPSTGHTTTSTADMQKSLNNALNSDSVVTLG